MTRPRPVLVSALYVRDPGKASIGRMHLMPASRLKTALVHSRDPQSKQHSWDLEYRRRKEKLSCAEPTMRSSPSARGTPVTSRQTKTRASLPKPAEARRRADVPPAT
ncbi:hypothetical protein MKEN_01379100 [Mycena kentingensis (nom. inval.)]|nr:hypothetical protein MKEN_01379100 [Mycena kentingensis (nom. inval.)]